MKKNMGTIDRTLRLLAAAIIIVLYMTDRIGGTWGIVLLVIAGVFIFTSFVSLCPLYSLLGLSTRRKTETE